jgi:hypothetical protein
VKRHIYYSSAASVSCLALLVALSKCGYDTTNNGATAGCASGASLSISPVAIPNLPSADGGAGSPTSFTLSGSVTNAPCGVQGVSVQGVGQAVATLTNFASWTVTAPLSLFESSGPCPDGGTGVWVNAVAQVTADPGEPPVSVPQSQCVALVQPSLPHVCPSLATQCIAPPPDAGSPAVQCQLPIVPGYPAAVALFTDAYGIGRQTTWHSTGGLVTIDSEATAVHASAATDPLSCPSACGATCQGDSFAILVGSASASPGVDIITATADGYPTPVATIAVAVQGPAKILPSATTLTSSTSIVVVVENPMSFQQTCILTLPVGIEAGIVSAVTGAGLNDAGLSGTAACGLLSADAGLASGPPCVFVDEFAQSSRIYDIAFAPGLTAGAVAAAGLATSRLLTLTCADQFSQTTTTSVTTSWGGATDAGTGSASSDAGSGEAGPTDAAAEASDAASD